jgi:hypothetical protein
MIAGDHSLDDYRGLLWAVPLADKIFVAIQLSHSIWQPSDFGEILML